jgi:hypothetical protein
MHAIVYTALLIIQFANADAHISNLNELLHIKNNFINISSCRGKTKKVFVYDIDIRNKSHLQVWKLGMNCAFSRFGSLNFLNHDINDWAKNMSTQLELGYAITTNAEEACMIIVPAIPNHCVRKLYERQAPSSAADVQRKIVAAWLRKLPYWNVLGPDGSNHIVLDYFDRDEDVRHIGVQYNYMNDTFHWDKPFYYATLDTGNAIVASSSIDERYYRRNFDIPIFLLHTYPHIVANTTIVRTTAETSVNAFQDSKSWDLRPHLVCFFGTAYAHCCNERKYIQKLALAIRNASILFVNKAMHNMRFGFPKDSIETLSLCKFGLVLQGKGFHSYRLLETLYAGAIPLIFTDYWLIPHVDTLPWKNISIMFKRKRILNFINTILNISSDSIGDYHDSIKTVLKNTFVNTKQNMWRQIYSEITNNLDKLLNV